MRISKIASFALAAALTAGIAAPLVAEEMKKDDMESMEMLSGADAIAKRKELMKSSGMTMRSAGGASGEEAVKVGETLVANFTEMQHLWPADSMEGDTKALANIWNEDGSVSDEFQTALDDALAAAEAVHVAAESGDAEAYGASLKAMGGTCGACHQTFRQSNN